MTTKQQEEALLKELLKNYQTPEDLLGENGLLKKLSKQAMELALEAEMEHHLGYAKGDISGKGSGNSRNGKAAKTVKGTGGEFDLVVPRDRNGEFEPQLIKKGQRRLSGLDERLIALYASGMTTRDIQQHMQDQYDVEVSPALISKVTDTVLADAQAWQSRPLDSVYPIVYLDALVVKSRQDGRVQGRTVYLALGVNMQGEKDLLGLWLSQNEGAKFWLSVLNELKNRGVEDILIACVDGLKGFPDAIEAVYPHTQIQLCVVHQVRYSLNFVVWKDKKAVARDLRTIYAAATLQEAEQAFIDFQSNWDNKYPSISPSWHRNWDRLTGFFDYPPPIRKVIYTTNAIESLNASIKKVTRNRKQFPNDEAIIKVVYLALQNAAKKWSMPIHDWKPALNQFMIVFGDRITEYV